MNATAEPAHGFSRRDSLLLVGAWILAIGYLLPFLFRGWIPHDEGLLGQLGERVLLGETPHVDFDDPYSGGLSALYAAAFAVLGVSLSSIRIVLMIAVAITLVCFLAIARRLVPGWVAVVGLGVVVTWTVANYFAGLPSWFNTFLAVAALWAMLRYIEVQRRRWLVLAGVLAGISCAIKIAGLFLVAAVLLVLVDLEYRQALRAPIASRPAPRRAFLALATIGGSAFALALIALVRPGLASGGSGSPAAVLGHFAVPGIALVAFLLFREWACPPAEPWTQRLRRLGGLVGLFMAGWSLPVGLLAGWLASHQGLSALYRGVFVLPKLRFQFATFPLPPVWAMLLAVPVVALLLWPRRVGRVAWVVAAVVSIGLAWAWAAADRIEVYRAIWLPVRALVPVTVVMALVWLARRETRSAARVRGQHPATVFAILATAAMVSLVQYPDAYGIYFFYTVPFVVLALMAVSAANPTALRPVLLVLALFAVAFGGRWLNHADAKRYGLSWRPTDTAFALGLPRAGLWVDPRSGATATAVVLAVLEHAAPGDAILAAPDCPEVYFLAGMRNPTRSFFEFFDPTFQDPIALGRLLDQHDVRVAVVNLRPSFSGGLRPEILQLLRTRFPNWQRYEDFAVHWRDGQ